MWVISPRAVVANLIVGHEVPASRFEQTRSINVPGILVAVEDMVAELRRVAGDAVADRVHWKLDPAIDKIVRTWPANFALKLGPALGMRSDANFGDIISAYIADDMPRA
jgi:D-erythronate 2-dehydrogenase